jgi:hypothetical protein
MNASMDYKNGTSGSSMFNGQAGIALTNQSYLATPTHQNMSENQNSSEYMKLKQSAE